MEALFGLPGQAAASSGGGGGTQSSTKKTANDAARSINRDKRTLDREIQRLKREEQKLCTMIKDAAKKPGGEQAARPLAKQLIKLREQQAQMSKASTQMSGVAAHVRTAGATATAAQSIAGATKAMGAVNRAMDPGKMKQTMQEFEKQSTTLGLRQEMMDDVFESLDDEFGDDDEEVLAQVMDEIGLDVASKMSSAPQGQRGGASAATARADDACVEALLQSVEASS